MARSDIRMQSAELEQALAKLRPIEREVLRLSAGERLRNDEIAARLGLSVDTVRRHLVDALYRLDLHLERQQRPWWRFW